MLRGCWGPQARERQVSWYLLDATDLQTVLWVLVPGIWLLTLISRTSSVCGCVALCCNHGGFLTVIYSCKMYLEQFSCKAIKFISALFPFWNVQFSKIKGQPRERGKINQIRAVLFLLSWCFSIQITFISETFLPMVFMIIHKSHLLVEWIGGSFRVSHQGVMHSSHGVWLSPK